MKTALITGITGQDGAYLTQLLLNKGYQVIGLLRKNTKSSTSRLDHLGITSKIHFRHCDLLDIEAVGAVLKECRPDEIYNLAAQSSVSRSFQDPVETLQFNILSVTNLLESILHTDKNIRFYQASSSEMFGSINALPLTENSIFHPVSPYGISKASAHWITINYRESFGLFTTSGILFNHESVLRESHFIIKKIIRSAIDIQNGRQDFLEVGNIDIKRDFGYAPKYVEAMYLMMQHERPDDYIIATGKSLSIREIIYYVFEKMNISKEKIKINQTFFRPNEIINIYGDASKARAKLGWKYTMSFFQVLDILIEEERIKIDTVQK